MLSIKRTQDTIMEGWAKSFIIDNIPQLIYIGKKKAATTIIKPMICYLSKIVVKIFKFHGAIKPITSKNV